jgi:MFS family permease
MESMENNVPSHAGLLSTTFVVSALGYFVDVYDLVLFGIVRVESLRAIGIAEDQILDVGVFLINCQMAGLLLGGILWGVLGDKRGRVSVLLGSILLYSLANIANAFVTSAESYAVLRFFAGIGLAGEVGAAVTLVSEGVNPQIRGIGTAILSSFGILGAVAAGLVGDSLHWQVAYVTGGALGLLLLLCRVLVIESRLYTAIKEEHLRRGDFRILFASWNRFAKYMCCILVSLPIWFVIGILMTFAPELSKAVGVQTPVSAGSAIFYCYIGLCVGDLVSGVLSQMLKSRRTLIFVFLLLSMFLSVIYLRSSSVSHAQFAALCVMLGFAAGYWSMFITLVAESFGTNIRATVVISVTNFMRGSVILMTLALQALKGHFSLAQSAGIVGCSAMLLALVALMLLKETFGRDLNFVESA